MNARLRHTVAAALAAGLLLGTAACGDDEDATEGAAPAATTSASAVPSDEPSDGPSADASESASPSASAEAEDGTTVTIDLVGGKPSEKVGPIVKVAKGDELTIVVTTDKAYEIHVHGLDLTIDAKPGETVTKTFTVDLAAGSYEVEVEETGLLLFNLQVK